MNCDKDEFLNTMNILNFNIRKYKYCLETKLFSPTQKKLLKAYFLFKKNKPTQSLELLGQNPIQDSFYEAIRLYLLSLSQNLLGSYKLSLANNKESINLCEQIDDKDFIIFPLIAICITLGNRKETNEMEKYILKLNKIDIKNEFIQLSIDQVNAIYFLLKEDFVNLKKTVRNALSIDSKFLPLFEASFILINFMASFKEKDYDACYFNLDAFKKSKGFSSQANYKFMKTLLDHIVNKTPLYIYQKDFDGYTELYHQLEVIKNLDTGDIDLAQGYWKKLQIHNKEIYKDDFIYNGDYCLFSKALTDKQEFINKYSKNINLEVLSSFSKDEEKVVYILEFYSSPISKYEIIDLIWKDIPYTKAEQRLYNIVHKLKKEDLKIINKNGAYYLENKKAS